MPDIFDTLPAETSPAVPDVFDRAATPAGFRSGMATVFGRDLNGGIDRQDNGVGAWGDDTRNPQLVGVSLPRRTLRELYGDEASAHGRMIEVINPATQQRIVAPIVDKGPADWTHHALDLTYAAAHQLGSTGRDFLHFRPVDGDVFDHLPDAHAAPGLRPPPATAAAGEEFTQRPPIDPADPHNQMIVPGGGPSPLAASAVQMNNGRPQLTSFSAAFAPAKHPAAVLAYGTPIIDPQRYGEGVTLARQQGWIDDAGAAQMMSHAEDVKALADERARLVAAAGDNQELKALLAGGTRGAMQLAGGYIAGETAAATGGALSGGNPFVAGGAGLIGGGIGAIGTGLAHDRAMQEMAKSNELAATLQASAKLQPQFAQTGELAAFALPAPSALGRLAEGAGLVNQARGPAAAATFAAKQVGIGASIGAGSDLVLRGAAQALGVPGVQLDPQSTATAAGIGALLSGYHVRIRDYETPHVADILRRGIAAQRANAATGDGGVVGPEAPLLSTAEQEVFDQAMQQLGSVVKVTKNGEPIVPPGVEIRARQVGAAANPAATVVETAVPNRAPANAPQLGGEPFVPHFRTDPIIVPPGEGDIFDQVASAAAAPAPITPGGSTVVFGARGTEYPATYAFAPTSAIQTSHSGAMMAANPGFVLTNTRDYSDPAERDKQLAVLQGFDPRRHVTDSPDAAVGPSIVGTVIDEQGHASLQRFGGNNRGYAIANLPADRRAALQVLQNQNADRFGLQPTAAPDAELVRHLGTFDLRQPGERERAQTIVDALNPSPGMIQSSAKRAQLDSANVPAPLLAGVPMDIAPADAQHFVNSLITQGLADRNLTASIAASPSQAQDYTQRLLIHAAFQQPVIAEVRNDPRTSATTVRGMIDAAVPALVQMRAQAGGAGIADAVSRAFTTTLGYLDHAGTTLPAALERAARQTEIEPEHAVAQDIATAMRSALVLDRSGKPRAAESTTALQTLFGRIAAAVAQHDSTPDIFGAKDSLGDVVRRALDFHARQGQGAEVLGMPAASPFGSPEQVLARFTRPNGTVHLNGDAIIATHPQVQAAVAAGRPIAEVNALYRALYPEAVKVRDAAFHLALKQPVTEQNRNVVLTAGGPGSGKSRGTAALPAGTIIYDTNLRDPAKARAMIAAIHESGRAAEVLYVHRNFAEAVRGNLTRAEEERRLSTAREIAEGHHGARASVLTLAPLDFSPGVRVRVIDNVQGGKSQPMTLPELAALPRPTIDQLTREAYAVADDTERDQTASAAALAEFRGTDPARRSDGAAGVRQSESGLGGGETPWDLTRPTPSGEGPALSRPSRPPTPLRVAMEGAGDVSIPQVLDAYAAIVHALGGRTPLRIGRFFQRALGIYKTLADVARIGNAGDIATAAHEVAHALQPRIFGTNGSAVLNARLPALASGELHRLGRALYGPRMPHNGYESEGWAEFWRLYLTDDTAATTAPEMTKWAAQWLAGNPAAARAIAQAKTLTDLWRSQGALNRARAQMPAGPSRLQRLRSTARSLFNAENWIEQFQPLRELAAEHQRLTSRALTPSTNPYELASARRGTSGTVTLQMVLHGMTDLSGNLRTDSNGRLIGSLAEIVAPVRGLEDQFAIYLWAERSLEIHARGLDPGMSLADAQHLAATLSAAHPDFGPAAQRLYAWQDAVLEYLAEANPALRPSIERIRQSSTRYVPLGRVMNSAGASAGVRTLAANPLMRLQGSGRQLKPLFEQIISNTQRLVAAAHKAQVLQTIAALAQTPGLGHLIEELPRDRVRNSLTVEQVRTQLENMGVDLAGLTGAEQLDFYTLADTPKGADPIIPVRRGNEVHWFQVAPELYELLSGLEPIRLGPLADLFLGVPARMFRLGTTGMRASFNLVTNPARDLQTLMMQTLGSDNPARVLAAYLSGMREAVFGGPVRDLFRQLAVEAGQPLGMDVQHTARAARALFHGPARQIATHPLEFLRGVLNFMESVPRIAEMRMVARNIGWTPGTPLTPDQAVAIANAGKRVTVDFSAGGSIAKQFNQAIPFFNASIQGARTFARTLRDRPMAAFLKAFVYFIAPALALWWAHRKERWYQDLPWRERYLYWNFSPDGKNVIQIPRPPEWGSLSAIAEGAVDSWYRRDPEGAEPSLAAMLKANPNAPASKAFGYVVAANNPADFPVLLKAAKEQWQNRIDFFDKPIVPRGQIDLPAGEQFAPYTSELAKALGRAFPDTISPRRIDAAVRSLAGGVGGDLLSSSDALVRSLGLVPKQVAGNLREPDASDLPVLGRIFRRGGVSSSQNQAVADFWDDYLRYGARKKSKTYPLDARGQLYYIQLESAHDQLKSLETIADATTSMSSRQSLFQSMAEIAHQTLQQRPSE